MKDYVIQIAEFEASVELYLAKRTHKMYIESEDVEYSTLLDLFQLIELLDNFNEFSEADLEKAINFLSEKYCIIPSATHPFDKANETPILSNLFTESLSYYHTVVDANGVELPQRSFLQFVGFTLRTIGKHTVVDLTNFNSGQSNYFPKPYSIFLDILDGLGKTTVKDALDFISDTLQIHRQLIEDLEALIYTVRDTLLDGVVEEGNTLAKLYALILGLRTDIDEHADVLNQHNTTLLELREDIGDLSTLTTTDKTNLVNAINELDAKALIIDDEISEGSENPVKNIGIKAYVDAAESNLKNYTDNAVNALLDGVAAAGNTLGKLYTLIQGLRTDIGNLTVVVEENVANIGVMEDLTTTSKQSLVHAINEVKGELSSLEGVDDYPTLNSNNTVKSGGVFEEFSVINGIVADIVTDDITPMKSDIGNIAALDTTNKSSLVAAINEVNSKEVSLVQSPGSSPTSAMSQKAITDNFVLGSDTRLTNQRTPTDSSVTIPKIDPTVLMTVGVAPAQQALLANAANWTDTTLTSAAYYSGTTALTGNKQGSRYFDGLYLYTFEEDDYPVRIPLSVLNGASLKLLSVAFAALDQSTQNRITTGNTQFVNLFTDPDYPTSDIAYVEGFVISITGIVLNITDGVTAPPITDFTFRYKILNTGTWLTATTVAALQTALSNTGTAGRQAYVQAVNTTSTFAAGVSLKIVKNA
jgi:hypothetical protein